MDRRRTLKLLAGAGALATFPATSLTITSAFAQTPPAAAPAGPFKLPPLGYAYDALEPHIDAQTMTIHHTKHHQAYVDAVNGLAQRWPELAKMSPEVALASLGKAPDDIRTALRNNMGGHWNHSFFWELMTPGGPKEPVGDLKAAIDQTFGGFRQFTDKVNAAGTGRFGSGWAWLVVTKDRKLDVISTPNQDPPLLDGSHAIVGVDVWEHAYYLKYQNRRADYLKSWWNVVNWDRAMANFKKAPA